MASREHILDVLRENPMVTTSELIVAMGYPVGTALYVREYENVRKKLVKMQRSGEVVALDHHLRSIPIRWSVPPDL